MQIENIHPAVIAEDIQLTATLPHEMVESQKSLIEWCSKKIESVQAESKKLKEAYEHAKACKWKFTTLENQFKKSLKTLSYYEKMRAALQEGYYIVPNFPIQMFAIRTQIKNPSGYSRSSWSDDFKQFPQELAIGIADYKNPFPSTITDNKKNPDGSVSYHSWADDWEDIDFPLTMAKPEIMKATTRAMALKIFDQIGIMPATKKEDPVIIGQIIHKVNAYTTKTVSFMIAWHLNTNVL